MLEKKTNYNSGPGPSQDDNLCTSEEVEQEQMPAGAISSSYKSSSPHSQSLVMNYLQGQRLRNPNANPTPGPLCEKLHQGKNNKESQSSFDDVIGEETFSDDIGADGEASETCALFNHESGIPIIPGIVLNLSDADSAFEDSKSDDKIYGIKNKSRQMDMPGSYKDVTEEFPFPYENVVEHNAESEDEDPPQYNMNLIITSPQTTWFPSPGEPIQFYMDISPAAPALSSLPMSASEENVMPNSFRDSPPDADVDFDGNPLLPPDCANSIEDKELCSPVFPSYDEDKENKADDDVCSRRLSSVQEETQYDVKWVPPDGGWGWMVLMGSLIVNILIPGMVKSYGVLFIEFLDVVNATPSSAAWIPALSYWLYSSMGPFASALAIAFSHRKITIIGGILASTGLALSYFATTVWHLCLSYGIIGGLGAGLAYPIGVFMVGDYFTEKRGLANGLCTSGSALGSVVIPPLLRVLLDAYGCKTAIVIMAGILLNVCIGALFYDPVEKHLKKVLVPREANTETEEQKSPTKVPKTSCIEIQDKIATRTGANREVAASLPIAIPTYNHHANVDVRDRDLRDHRGSGSIRRATFQIGHDTPQGESWSLKSMDGIGTSPLAIRLMKEDTGNQGSSPRIHLLRNRQPQNQAVHSFESNSDAGDSGNVGSTNLFPQGVSNHGQSRLNLTAIPEDDDNDMSPSENEMMIHPSDATNRNIDWKYFPEVPPSNQRNMRLSVGGGNQLLTGSQQNTSGLSRTLSVASNVSTSSFHYVSTIHHGSLLSALQAEQTVPEFPSTHTLKPVHTSCCSSCLSCTFRKCRTDEVDKEPDKITPPPLKQKLQPKKFIDFSLFKDGIYIIMLLSNSTTAVGYTNFIILLPAYALKLGLDKSEASLLLSVVAGFDFFGRIGGAALSDLQFISRKWFYIVGLFLSGVALTLLPMAVTYRSLFIYCACFGLASGTYVGVTAVILADELGSEKLGSSYGITLFVNGVFQLAGPPICGMLLEKHGRYQPILRALGIILVMGALFWLAVPVIEHRRKRIAQKSLLQGQKENNGNQVQETSMTVV